MLLKHQSSSKEEDICKKTLCLEISSTDARSYRLGKPSGHVFSHALVTSFQVLCILQIVWKDRWQSRLKKYSTNNKLIIDELQYMYRIRIEYND